MYGWWTGVVGVCDMVCGPYGPVSYQRLCKATYTGLSCGRATRCSLEKEATYTGLSRSEVSGN